MGKSFFLISLLPFFLSNVYAQLVIRGKVLQPSEHALPYVNIGIKGKNIGTVSNEDGAFSLNLKAENAHDTLTFSCIGFEEISLPVQKIIQENTSVFYLKEKFMELKEVVITSKKAKIKKIGTKSANPLLWGSATSKDGKDIIEMGKLISIQEISEIQALSIYLKGINTNTVTFRINFYDVKDEMPSARMVEQQILCKKDLSKGWLEIDLTAYNLIFDKDLFVGIEFLPEKDSKGYSFSYGGQMGGSVWVREASLGSWKKTSGATISMYLTVKQ
jgi:hypothetical protein